MMLKRCQRTIERLVKEAEKYKDEDKHIKEKSSSLSNNLELFVYQTDLV